jgi:hypothetical protein
LEFTAGAEYPPDLSGSPDRGGLRNLKLLYEEDRGRTQIEARSSIVAAPWA